jgi:hypothetical protein
MAQEGSPKPLAHIRVNGIEPMQFDINHYLQVAAWQAK